MELIIKTQAACERPEKWPKVAVIILNWNGYCDTIDCLESLQRVDYENFEVVVVDNASRDESVEKILSWCRNNGIWYQQLSYNPDDIKIEFSVEKINGNTNSDCAFKHLVLLRLSKNTGFCGGNNIGMMQAASNGAEFFLVLNNDTIVTPKFLKPMVEVACNDKKVGLVGGIICYADNPDRIWFAGGYLDGYLESHLDHQGDLYSNVVFDQVYDTGLVTGCLMLIPKSVYDRLGGFYEKFFIWSEDWDYSFRVKKAGYKLVLASQVRIFHKCGRSLGVMKPLSYYYGTRNRLILKRLHVSRFKRWPFLAFFLVSRVPRYAYFAIRGRWDLVISGSFATWDYLKGKTGKWENHAD